MTLCPFKSKVREIWYTERHRKKLCKDAGPDYSFAATSQGEPRMGSHQLEAGRESRNPPSFRASRGQPCQRTDLGFLAPRTVRKLMSVVLSHHVCGTCYGSPRKLTQYMIIYMHLYICIKIISIPKMDILDCYNKNLMYICSDSWIKEYAERGRETKRFRTEPGLK